MWCSVVECAVRAVTYHLVALPSVEILGDARLTTRLHIPEHRNPQQHGCKKFKSRNMIVVVGFVWHHIKKQSASSLRALRRRWGKETAWKGTVVKWRKEGLLRQNLLGKPWEKRKVLSARPVTGHRANTSLLCCQYGRLNDYKPSTQVPKHKIFYTFIAWDI